MNADYYRLLFDYGWWARDTLFEAAVGMSDDEWRATNAFTRGSIASVLRHTMQAERSWSKAFRREPQAPRPADMPEPSMTELMGEWYEEEGAMRAWLQALDDAGLQQRLPSRNNGPEFIYWQAMSHVTYHSMQHRSEAAEALTQIGRSPGELDLIFFLMGNDRLA
jgi:uncharacterized damage-inducible protein DinB